MKTKSPSELSLEELHKHKKKLNSVIIGLAFLWIIIFAIIIIIAKYNLLTTFFPLAIATVIPIYSSLSEINSEMKKRNSNDS